jgi:MFS family permease
MVGCIIVGWLADRVGRVRTIQMICALSVISAIIQGASVHIGMFLAGRTLGGMGAAMMNAITPIYQSEVSPADMRGKMVGTHGFLIVCGYVSEAHPSANDRD